MLEAWLGDIPVDEFRRAYLGRAPLAQPSSVTRPTELLDWNVLDIVLATPGLDCLIVARGRLLELPAPTRAGMLAMYMAEGAGVCLRHVERHHPGLATVARDLERTLAPCSAQVQLFVTPPNTYGFAWHYDDEDVFIVQTAGVKDYYFRENTVARDRPAHAKEFGAFTSEQSTIMTARLVAGDFLYLPARWWHMAECLETSLSVSIGVAR